ncbi:MAG: rod shape-determining protein MreD [Candidatus Omnitrophota bacterium]
MYIRGQTLNPRNLVLVLLLNFGVQYLAFKYLRFLNITPDLTLIFIIYLNLFYPETTSLLVAFSLGLYQDLFFRSPVGSHSLIYLLAAYLANKFSGKKIRLTVRSTFFFSLFFSLFFSFGYQMLSLPVWGPNLFWKPVIFSLYNGIWAMPAFYLYHRGLA